MITAAVLALGAATAFASDDRTPAPLAASAAPVIATIDGIPGDTGPTLDVTGFAVGAKNTPVTAGGGGSAGKVQFDAVRFTKAYDAASPKLLLRTASGQHIPSATFVLRKGATTITYKLSDVVVTGYRQENLVEQVELGFSQVQVTYQPATGAATTAGWDVKLNRSI
jgi:type VI secretion system secreted protein Hcp